jgi:antitoxin component YwqK of YwqJK toxin-antitoxin module
MKNLLAFFLFVPLFFAISCQTKSDKPKETNTDTSTIQTAQIQPNDKEIVYYENGQAQFMQQYLNGIKHGEYKDWYKNGQLRTMGYFDMGMRNGTWQWYGEKGDLTLQVKYDKQVAQL